MKNSIVIFLIVFLAGAMYFLGKKNGEAQTKIHMVRNTALVRQIAELGALDVTGNVNLNITNKSNDPGIWSRFKNYFAENTIRISLPFEAKYGVDLSDQKLSIDTKASTISVYLPHCKLLSLQLKMDSIETISRTGIFISSSADDLVKAQKILYNEALQKLANDSDYLKQAEQHVSEVLSRYYKILGYKVTCNFNKATPLSHLQ